MKQILVGTGYILLLVFCLGRDHFCNGIPSGDLLSCDICGGQYRSGADDPESEESLLVSPADGAVVGVTGAGAGVGVTDGFSESSDVVPGVLKT